MAEVDIVECPHCGTASEASTLSEQDFLTYSRNARDLFHRNSIQCHTLRCADVKCKKSSLWISYCDSKMERQEVKLVPKSSAKPLPEYIPKGLREDYEEACLILEDSPKASAALARRCLQGMIRDFWKVKKRSLYGEIKAIKKKIDTDLYNALLGLKDIGNIGAHPELIVDVNKSDACHLVSLLKSLFDLWYVADHTKKECLSAVSLAAQRKKQEKKESRTDGKQPDSLESPSVVNIEQPK